MDPYLIIPATLFYCIGLGYWIRPLFSPPRPANIFVLCVCLLVFAVLWLPAAFIGLGTKIEKWF